MTATPTLAEVIAGAMESRLSELHVALPGRIDSYDASTQKARVQPLIRKKFIGADQAVSMPIINNVPVVFPRTANAIISMPISKGDNVLLLFSERSMDNWLSTGGEADPGVTRKHDISDAIAIPGLYPFSDPSDASGTDLLLKLNNIQMRLQPGNKMAFGTSATELMDTVSQLTDVVVKLLQTLSTATFPVGVASPFYAANALTLNILKTKHDQTKGTL